MPRFSSLVHVPAETRRILRDRFLRFLRAQFSEFVEPTRGNLFPDELLLRLLLNLKVEYESDLERAKATYATALVENPDEPNFDDVLAAGWVRVVGGRIKTPFEVAREANRRGAGPLKALATVLRKRFEERFLVSDLARNDPELGPLVIELDKGERATLNLRCQDPRWVAARLWDRSPFNASDSASALRLWIDRWHLLGAPSLLPTQAWAEDAGNAFLQAAMSMLEKEPSLVGWQDTRSGFVKQIALGAGQQPQSMERYVPPVPETLIDRALWLDDLRLERAVVGTIDAHDDVFGVVRILMGEVAAAGNALAPHWIFGRLFELATERAELFLMILFQIRLHPTLLADLVLHPASSALACFLVAQWRPSSGGAWDRELTSRDDETTKNIAFADAVAVMGHFLAAGSLAPREAASLLRFLHTSPTGGFVEEGRNSESMLATLRAELVSQSLEIQKAIFAELTLSMPQMGLGTPTFAAALDVLAAGQLAEIVDPNLLLEAYISAVAAGGYGLSANRVGVSAATSLAEVAMKAPEELRERFFHPIDMKARIAAAEAPDANPYMVNDDTARSIRAHVRILCRAVTGLESLPAELTDALIGVVRVGAVSHAERRRVAAFAARFETDPYRGRQDRPIAADLGAALGALVGDPREKLLAAVLEIDEPMVLAQLLSYAPHALQDRIKGCIAAITPENAGDTRSLPESQARIDALLSAGLADSAARFIDAERELRTFGKVPGRAVVRLRASLALKLLRGDWAGVAAAELPSELMPQEREAAVEAITFYKALAALSDPTGDREGAVHTFTQLQRRHPQVGGYAINLFAAQITSLLGDNLFTQLHGANLVRGRQVLDEAEQAMRRSGTPSVSEMEIFEANKALLLLALGQPDRAHEVLSSLRVERLGERIAAYSAIALARMGRVAEAIAALDEADGQFGKTNVVSAARAHIESGARYAAIANLASEDDPVPRLQKAFWEFSRLDHFRQAAVSADSFEAFAVKHMRAAAETVTSLVPMMKSISMDSREDDLNALVGAVLAARVLTPLGWTVPDQTKGGFTAKGGPGERDLIVQKDGTLISIIEALICDRPLTHKAMQDDLTNHFRKLLGYGLCSLYFHLTYSYLPNPSDVLNYLRTTAETDAPAGFTYIGREEIPQTDARPVGFIARYKTELGEVAVVFLLLDMEQHAQRAAGKAGRPVG